MIQSSSRAGGSALSQMLATLGRASRQRLSTGFARQLESAGESTKTVPAETRGGRAARQDLVSRAVPRYDLGASANPATPATAATTSGTAAPAQTVLPASQVSAAAVGRSIEPATNATVAPQAANRADTVTTDPVSVLTNALTAAGVAANGVKFTRTDEMVGYPGGSYRNHVITAEFSDGRRESFGVDLMMRNPRVTVVELGRMLGFTVSGEQLNRIQVPVQS